MEGLKGEGAREAVKRSEGAEVVKPLREWPWLWLGDRVKKYGRVHPQLELCHPILIIPLYSTNKFMFHYRKLSLKCDFMVHFESKEHTCMHEHYHNSHNLESKNILT